MRANAVPCVARSHRRAGLSQALFETHSLCVADILPEIRDTAIPETFVESNGPFVDQAGLKPQCPIARCACFRFKECKNCRTDAGCSRTRIHPLDLGNVFFQKTKGST